MWEYRRSEEQSFQNLVQHIYLGKCNSEDKIPCGCGSHLHWF